MKQRFPPINDTPERRAPLLGWLLPICAIVWFLAAIAIFGEAPEMVINIRGDHPPR